MDTGNTLDQLWTDFITTTRNHAQDTDYLAGQQERALGFTLFDHRDSDRLIQDAANTLYESTIDLAAHRFTPPGAQPIEISTHDYYEDYREPFRDADSAPSFKPSELWAALERDYGGEKGATKALMEAADRIRSFFSESLRSRIVRRGGCVVLTTVHAPTSRNRKMSSTAMKDRAITGSSVFLKNSMDGGPRAACKQATVRLETMRSRYR